MAEINPVAGQGGYEVPGSQIPSARDPRLTLPSSAPLRALPVGMSLQRGLTIGESIGRGGLGQVNSGIQRVFERDVAIKRLHAGVVDPAARQKFFAEALIAAQLEHPNIVPIHDLVLDADGQLQLVMKRVEGVPWRSLLERSGEPPSGRKTTLDDHLDILLKVCDAVAFAHGRGILHCDLKPDNVMVGAFGEVLLMDWGCALAFSGDHHPAIPVVRQLTSPCGTPSYLAPEMAMALPSQISPASDVYQLGAILYELLTGSRANRGDDVGAVMKDAAMGVVVPPQQAAPSRSIPDELAHICMESLVKDPINRIATVSAFAQRIRSYRQHAQAIGLAARARTLVSQAQQVESGRDDLLRKALSCAEQAGEIWSDWSGAKVALYDAQMAYARHHLETGAAAAAVMLAGQAAAVAGQLARPQLLALAGELHQLAVAQEEVQRAHQRQLRIARLAVIIATAVLVSGLAISVVLVEKARHRAATAFAIEHDERAKFEQALRALSDEQVRRSADQKTSAPALVAQARRAIQGKQWDEAARVLETAIGFDPHLIEARQLRAAVLVGAGRYSEAITAAQSWLELVPGQANALRLRELCAQSRDGTKPTIDVQVAFAALFDAMQLFTLAEEFALSAPMRLELYRKRIEQAWPGAGGALSMRADGHLVSEASAHQRFGLAGRDDVVDLAPHAGMPFAVLDLSRTGVRDIAVLHGMPLEELAIDQTQVDHLDALSGMPLRALHMAATKITDLSPLQGLPLEWLAAQGSAIATLGAVQGRSFSHLDISGTRVESLAPLSGARQGELIVRATRVHALSPLIGTPIASLDLTGCQLDDLAILGRLQVARFSGLSLPIEQLPRIRGLPVTGLDLGESHELTDLRALGGFRLESLVVRGGRVRDLSPLSGMPLHQLDCSGNPIADLAPLSGMPLHQLDISHCQVHDLTPLRDCPLESLRASGNPLRELGILAGKPLHLLFIDNCAVQDLSALAGLPLEEMRLGPFNGRAISGLAGLRGLPSLRILGSSPEQALPADEYWRLYDAKRLP
jgi:Leucine-rich repeat (LRR) protein/tetratricopeptide (TPR) repeat protein